MNYLIVFLICVILGVLFIFGIYNFTKKEKENSFGPVQNKRAGDLVCACFIGIVLVVFFALLSPVIYEFKPWIPDTQYKIIRDSKGKIVDLEKNATGFHWPFYSNGKFVCLSDTMKYAGEYNKIQYRTFDGGLLEIKFTLTCDEYPKAFIASNGIFAKGAIFYILGATKLSFMDWGRKDFSETINYSFSCIKKEEKPKKLETREDVYGFVVLEADWWNDHNPYGCKIELEPLSLDRPFSVK